MKTMQALQWDGSSLAVRRVPVPEPGPGEVRVRLTRAGICNTDLEITRGYYPFSGTLGHEFVGVVDKAGDSALVGKRIVADINASCHACSMCLAGHPHHCRNRTALGIKGHDGAFAEFLTVPAENLVFVPDTLPDERAVFAEPLAAALEIQEQVDFADVPRAAVIGDGKLGLLIALSLARSNIAVTLVGHHPERAQLPGLERVTFHESPPEEQFAVVVEATGSPSGFADALRLTAPLGTLVLKSTYKDPISFNPAPLVVNEITLVGSRCGPMDKAVAMMASGAINPAVLVQETISLENAVDAFDRASAKGALKILLAMPQG